MSPSGRLPSDRFSRRTGWRLQPNSLTQAQAEMQASRREVVDLTLSNPTRAGLDFDANTILQALCNPAALDYDPQPKGMSSARAAIAGYYRERPLGRAVNPEAIVITTSTSEGYSFVMRLLADPGDELLVPRPSYPLFEFLADLQDVKLRPYELIYDHGWQIDFESLQRASSERTRAALTVHPNNPTGSYVRPGEQAQLNAFCGERGIALIVDEVFLDYAHDGISRPSFVANQDVLTFTLSGLSKVSAMPQMKVAWIATSGPEPSVSAALARLEVIADTFLSMNAPMQLAAPVLLKEREKMQPQLLERVRTNLGELDLQLAANPACRRLNVEGGWYAVLRVPVTQSDEEVAIRMLREKSVLVHPGHFYDFAGDGYLVLSLITPCAQFREGITRMFDFLAHAG
jgi:alanine-synthesizing transaminase